MPEIYVEGLKPKTFKNNDTAERKTKIGKITPVDARLFNAFGLSKKVGVFKGYGGDCRAINTMVTANNDNTYSIILNKGAICIYGGIAIIEQGTTITVPNTYSNGSFGVRVNLQNSAGAEMQFYYKSQSEALIQNDLQEDEVSGIYEFELYKYSISGSILTLTQGSNFNDVILSNEEQFNILIGKTKDYIIDNLGTTNGWIRVWASGFKEMGGVINTGTAGIVDLTFDESLKFKDLKYSVVLTPEPSDETNKTFTAHITNKTENSFKVSAYVYSNGGAINRANVTVSYFIAGF